MKKKVSIVVITTTILAGLFFLPGPVAASHKPIDHNCTLRAGNKHTSPIADRSNTAPHDSSSNWGRLGGGVYVSCSSLKDRIAVYSYLQEWDKDDRRWVTVPGVRDIQVRTDTGKGRANYHACPEQRGEVKVRTYWRVKFTDNGKSVWRSMKSNSRVAERGPNYRGGDNYCFLATSGAT